MRPSFVSASTPPRLRTLRAIPILAVAATIVAGCGNTGEATTTEPARGVGGVRVGSVSYLAQCRDWVAGTEEQRLATIADIRAQINTGDPGVQNPTLSDEAAYDVFENACSHDYATGFRLYKLYFRASAYEPLVAP
jgi:hypothetical protein